MEGISHIMIRKSWEKQVHEQEILNCMEDAIKEEQFKVYFQPKYDLNSEKVAGAERHWSDGYIRKKAL